MGGLILDNVIVLVCMTVGRWIFRFRCRQWPIVEGKIETSQVTDMVNPCAKVTYTYTVEGVDYDGTYRRGFWIANKDLAELVTGRFGDLRSVVVRYDPASPSHSYLMEEDQAFSTRETQET